MARARRGGTARQGRGRPAARSSAGRSTAARRPAARQSARLAASPAAIVLRLVAVAVLAWLGGFAWFALTLPGPAALTARTDAVVVLTGGAGRLARGVAVLQAQAARRLLVSGVGQGVGKGVLAAAVAASPALFARVDLGHTAVDTRSNAIETTAWATRHGYRSLRLVTSAAHMRRARLELATQLPASVAVTEDAVPDEPGADSLAREYTKFLLRSAALAVGAV